MTVKRIEEYRGLENAQQKLLEDIGADSVCMKYKDLLSKLTDISVSNLQSNGNYYKKKFVDSRKPAA